MTFDDLLAPSGLRALRGGGVRVRGAQHDSRAVEPGDVFVALAGARTDGARFIDEAARRGAVAVVAAHELSTPLALAIAAEPRSVLGPLAARVYGEPMARLPVVGITGTNGKTTTSYLVDAALASFGGTGAVVGTLGYRIGRELRPGAHTTPEADDLQRLARDAVLSRASRLVMEVSSHALAQGRVLGCRFDVAVLTNLTQDHLDFHGTMEEYAAAKRRLFTDFPGRTAVLNLDDLFGRALAAEIAPPIMTYSTDPEARADLSISEMNTSHEGFVALVRTPCGPIELHSPLLGRHNLENALAALGAALALGIQPELAAAGIGSVTQVTGRLECVPDPRGRLVVVDYAHTPDALERALDALRPLARGRLVCVFGCGGDRDRDKRPLMGRAVAARADLAIVTSDNPRTEEPIAIIADILPGLGDSPRLDAGDLRRRGYLVEPDRRAAIGIAIATTGPGDCVLLAGKGHEDYQIIGTERRHFSDVEEAQSALWAHG